MILVVDVGTSSMRGVLVRKNGELAHTIQIPYSPEYLPNDRVEQDPLTFRNSLVRIATEAAAWCAANGEAVEGISLTAQRSSVIPVDRDGNPLANAFMWQDRRALPICRELADRNALVFERTGTRINPVFAAVKMTWIRRNEPELYEKSHKLLVIADFLIHAMTGMFVTDYTYGSRTSLMNIRTLDWDDEMLDLFEVERKKLCKLVPQGTVLGCVTKEFSALTGVPAGTPVVSAGGDQQCGALGAGVIDAGTLQVTTGTGSFLIASVDRPMVDPLQRYICNVSAVPGKYIIESSILTSSSVYNWFFRNFYLNHAPDAAMPDTIDRDAEASPVGANGVVLLPHFQGRGSPDWNGQARGVFYNLNLGSTRGDMARAILEGIAAEVAGNIAIMREAIGSSLRITVAGGMTKAALFNQIQADYYEDDVFLPVQKETTVLGAWCSAAVALRIHDTYAGALAAATHGKTPGRFEPDPAHLEACRLQKRRRAKLYDALVEKDVYACE